MDRPKLTIGTAVYDDCRGLAFTLQTIRLYHKKLMPYIELLAVDNNPGKPHGQCTQALLSNCGPRARYIPFPEPVGTAPPRNKVFEEAAGEWVLCLDSHVILDEGALPRLFEWIKRNPNSPDLLTGPILWDDLNVGATHFQDVWRAGMWGAWGTDPRLVNPDADPLEIGAMGLGLFVCRKDAWLGFNEKFRGFGGEEWYIHHKYRRAGRRCLSLPFLRWWHLFGRPDGVPYAAHLTDWNKARNYWIGLTELGLDTQPVYDMFVATHTITEEQWAQIKAGAEAPAPCQTCGQQAQPVPIQGVGCGNAGTLEAAYLRAAQMPSDINEHVPTLRDLAKGCDTVVEFGVRHAVSTVALLAGQPKRLVSVDLHDSAEARNLGQLAGQTQYEFWLGDSRTVPPIPCDLLFIDTRHTADQLIAELRQHAPHAQRIALHDTEIFGEQGENGGPGLLPALRLYVRENPEWTVIKHYRNNHGFTVLSRRPEDKPELPSTARQVLNFAKAMAKHVANGLTLLPEDQVEARLNRCALCELRVNEQCGKCGCPLIERADGGAGKALLPTEDCPLAMWPPVKQGAERKAA